jgi:hypothetical protein
MPRGSEGGSLGPGPGGLLLGQGGSEYQLGSQGTWDPSWLLRWQ